MGRIKRIILIGLTVTLITLAFQRPVEAPAHEIIAKPTNEALMLINSTRQAQKLPELGVDIRLNKSAEAKCNHMVEKDYWAHSGGGREWATFIRDEGVGGKVGEILARGFKEDNTGRHQAWLNSPPHRAVIVDGNYKAFGVAECQYDSGKSLTVVHFKD